MMRWRIQAWGHPELPDLDLETNNPNDPVLRRYPCISRALQVAIPASAVKEALDDRDRR
jgi:hypothetical protein